jgi:hypothetical protein
MDRSRDRDVIFEKEIDDGLRPLFRSAASPAVWPCPGGKGAGVTTVPDETSVSGPPAGDRRPAIERLEERIGDPCAFVSQFVELDDEGRGSCPLHPPDPERSFVCDRQTGRWTCFHERDPKTGAFATGNVLALYCRLRHLSLREALAELGVLR